LPPWGDYGTVVLIKLRRRIGSSEVQKNKKKVGWWDHYGSIINRKENTTESGERTDRNYRRGKDSNFLERFKGWEKGTGWTTVFEGGILAAEERGEDDKRPISCLLRALKERAATTVQMVGICDEIECSPDQKTEQESSKKRKKKKLQIPFYCWKR